MDSLSYTQKATLTSRNFLPRSQWSTVLQPDLWIFPRQGHLYPRYWLLSGKLACNGICHLLDIAIDPKVGRSTRLGQSTAYSPNIKYRVEKDCIPRVVWDSRVTRWHLSRIHSSRLPEVERVAWKPPQEHCNCQACTSAILTKDKSRNLASVFRSDAIKTSRSQPASDERDTLMCTRWI